MMEFTFTLLSYLPAALVAALAWHLGPRTGRGVAAVSDRQLVYAIALWLASATAAVSAFIALYTVTVEARKPTAKMFASLNIIAVPVFVLGITLLACAAGWGLAEVCVQAHRIHLGATGLVGGAMRSILPLCVVAVVFWIVGEQARLSPVEKIWRLAASPKGERKLAAMYRAATAKRDLNILEAMAKAPRMPSGVLRMLAGDADVSVRACVANHENTPLDLLERFVHDDSREVRRALAWNRAATVPMLKVLASDPDEELRQAAQSRLETGGIQKG